MPSEGSEPAEITCAYVDSSWVTRLLEVEGDVERWVGVDATLYLLVPLPGKYMWPAAHDTDPRG